MATLNIQTKNAQADAIVTDFVRKDKGYFIVSTEDPLFLAGFRTVLNKHLNLPLVEAMVAVPEPTRILKALQLAATTKRLPFLLLESSIGGQDAAFLVKQFKDAFPGLLVLILSVDAERHRIVHLHEAGANSFIVKPVSAQTIIEKLAFAIKPRGQLGHLIDAAKALLALGEAEKAKHEAGQILKMKPGSAAGLMVLGDAEAQMGNLEAARRAYQEAAANTPLYLEPLRKLAELAEKNNKPEECLSYLEQLDELSPLNFERKVSMGSILLSLGNEEKAHALFETAMDIALKDAMTQIGNLAERVAVVYGEKNPENAEKFLRKALDLKNNFLSRDDIRVFNQLGVSLRQQGKWSAAIEEYKRALVIAPDDETLYYNTGMAYVEGERMSEALACMEKAFELNKDFPRTSAGIAYNMGTVFMKNGVRDKGRLCLEIAVELDPDMRPAKTALGSL